MPVQLGAPPQHGFDEPLGLLSDCHRRIEQFLAVLHHIAKVNDGQPLPCDHRDAAETALTYFRNAAPRHTQDEELSLFPLLRSSAEPTARAALNEIKSLEDDHAAADTAHREVDDLYRRWIDAGHLDLADRQRLMCLLKDLTQMYQQHIQLEDTKLFPLAAKVLGRDQLDRLGTEMAARRGLPAGPRFQPQPQGDASMETKSTIDVRTIPRPQRHPLIFQTFEQLQPGEALELINDHDPFPLRNQFTMIKRNQFSWDYLQQGPELWRVRISKVSQPPEKTP